MLGTRYQMFRQTHVMQSLSYLPYLIGMNIHKSYRSYFTAETRGFWLGDECWRLERFRSWPRSSSTASSCAWWIWQRCWPWQSVCWKPKRSLSRKGLVWSHRMAKGPSLCRTHRYSNLMKLHMSPFSMEIFFRPSSEWSLRKVFEIGSCDEPKNRDSIDY